MKKKIRFGISWYKKTAAVLIAAAIAVVSFGAYAEVLPNFSQSAVYDEYTYADVYSGDWYYYYVGFAYEYGIMRGVADGYFAPSGNISVAEAITVGARLNSTFYGNVINMNVTANAGELSWFVPYLAYAAGEGIIAPAEFAGRYAQPASRAELAHILYRSLPQCFDKINDISPIPDVSASNIYYPEILTMYEAGVLTGSDEYGTFYPDSYVRRSEAAAMISRVAAPDLRTHFTLNQNKPYASLSYTWQYPYGGSTFSANIDISYYDYNYFASKPRTYDYKSYAQDSADNTAIYAVASAIKNAAIDNGYTSEYDIAGVVAAFVQSLEYQDDMLFKGVREYPKYPIETLFEKGGDCEDTAVLLAKMLKMLDYGAVLLVSRDHMAVGIQTSGQGNLSHDGVNYYYIETTEAGWRVGEVPSDLVGISMEIVYI